jgi:hypothetical protein
VVDAACLRTPEKNRQCVLLIWRIPHPLPQEMAEVHVNPLYEVIVQSGTQDVRKSSGGAAGAEIELPVVSSTGESKEGEETPQQSGGILSFTMRNPAAFPGYRCAHPGSVSASGSGM